MPFRNTVFDADTLRIVTAAYDGACAAFDTLDDRTRKLLAQRIIDLATAGERDIETLKAFALDAVPQ